MEGSENIELEEDTKICDKVVEKKKPGRKGPQVIDEKLILPEKRLRQTPRSGPATWRTSVPAPPSTPKSGQCGSSSRPMFYLLDQLPSSFKTAKIPTTEAVLGRYLKNLQNSDPKEAAAETRRELKDVWLQHFGPRLVEGREFGIEEKEDKTKKIIKSDRHIDDKIRDVWKEWDKLEKESRKPARAASSFFTRKQDRFRDQLKVPFNITAVNAEEVIRESGIKDWQEETEYLRNQLSVEQPGCLGSRDKKQSIRDKRIITQKIATEKKDKEREKKIEELEKTKNDEIVDDKLTTENNFEDKDFIANIDKKKKKKVDVMSSISLTADRTNVSYQARAMIAASAINAMGGNINETNISKTTAWRKAQEIRSETAANIKNNFQCPPKVTVHWDGKCVNLKGNVKSNRICVYVTGADLTKSRKLLGVPETASGTGVAEANIVKEMLADWGIKAEVVGMVFDTTSSNTGKFNGACKFIEEWMESPVLWIACRHHISELHMMNVVHVVTGNTTDPGVKIFRRLKKVWSDLQINLDNLVTFETGSLDPKLQELAASVLVWAMEQQDNKVWPREDYKEMLDLLIVTLGGTVKNFTFKMPGADHHARWMSKVIYYLKIRLLSNIFVISPEEKEEVSQITEFIVLFYAKYWLQAPLPAAAARTDLDFMVNIHNYRLIRPKIAFAILQSTYRHLWYLTPHLVILSLADMELEDTNKEQIAKALHSCKQVKISTGKPEFPVLSQGPDHMRKNMASLVTSESWLVFHLLGLEGPNDWLQTPASLWHLFKEYRIFQEFAWNISVCNDIAERGIHLMSDFIGHCESEDQRQALFQCVEYHRQLVPNVTKESLKKC